MNFDELANLINDMKKIEGENCLICTFPIDKNIKDNIINLKCKHTYHNTCISSIKKNNIIICPYCQKSTRLYNNNNSINQDKTNEQLFEFSNKYNTISNICKPVLKKNIVSTKIKKALPTTALPTVALPTVALPTAALPTAALPTAVITINQNKCTYIIKTGKKKGLVCNTLLCTKDSSNIINCSRHIKKNIDKIICEGDMCNNIHCNHTNKNQDKCSTVIKTGQKKGLLCGRINCKIHNKNITV